MASYTAIADAGQQLVQILQNGLVPEVIAGAHNIGLCTPSDRGEYALGVHLYDIRESEEVRSSGMLNTGLDRQQYPPMYVSLYYMITAFSDSDLKFRAAEEQRIIGSAMQVLYDHPVIPAEFLSNRASGINARIELQNPDMDEKLRVWNVPNTPYRASLFYRITPVEIESARTKRVARVTDIVFGAKEQSHG